MLKKSFFTSFIIVIVLLLLVSHGVAESTDKERALIDWGQNYIEATGMAVAPKGTVGAQARALARRGALVDLQRNLYEFIGGVRIDARTTMEDFMAEDRVRSEINGFIRGVEVLKGEWDGESYTVTGRLRTTDLRVLIERVCNVTIKVR